ncbi:MAG: NAD(P)-dependent oxidoreductase [Candidatus Tectomicrobia bacterium]|uniref:NAD(P)-dependent oxidoreductase n=1 Tax=Tectimicrobiota bacterium TaxID=2528274 RepID=A0A937W4T4_UNCTE|nr:NAD(P)-dependent oxidoreductase [Candidatus Tectomicrobia bacterium]
MPCIGLIHPGAMGASVGAAARGNNHRVLWASQGRSADTLARAHRANLEDIGTVPQMVAVSDIILSVCPPHAAGDVARTVMELGYAGIYVDCNAVSPQRTRAIQQIVEQAGATYVDGGIIGGPAWKMEAGTHLYLSGQHAAEVAACFTDSPLRAPVLSDRIGAASAIKMGYAAYTKGTTALLTAILGMVEREGVRIELQQQWGETFSTQTIKRVCSNTAKAWRFEGEMYEIADTFRDAGLPNGFHLAAAEIYKRLASFHEDDATPPIEQVLAVLLGGE